VRVEKISRRKLKRDGLHVRLVAWWLLRTRYRLVEEDGWRLEVKRRGHWTHGTAFPEGDRWRCEQQARAGALSSARGYAGWAKLTPVGYVRMLVGR
jgi:hypothetical protein